MSKTGPAFSDFVSQQHRTRRLASSSTPASLSWITGFIPIVALVLVFSFLFIRLFYLQVVRAEYYQNLSENNRIRTVRVKAERGIIFDRYGRPLARNVPSYRILDEKGQIKWIEEEEALQKIAEKKDSSIALDVQREYPIQDAFAHVVGYVGQISEEELTQLDYKDYGLSDFIGKMGLEKEYEMVLKGTDGKELYEQNAKGEIVQKLGSQDPIAGQDIHATLDVSLQQVVHVAFKDVSKGVAIVSDPRDGGIIALYSKPTFDPNLFTHSKKYTAVGEYKNLDSLLDDVDNQPFLNRAISGSYPPGSVYKLVSAIAALSTGAISEDTEIEDTGVIKIGDFTYGNWYFSQYGRKEGVIDIIKAIKRSNDIFFYRASQETGIDELSTYSKIFGLGQTLGIDLPGEAKGLVPDPSWKKKVMGEQWYLGDTFHIGIGQGFLLTTPLQVNSFTSVFANKGILYKPHLLAGKKEILRKDFMKQEHAELIRAGMKGACDPGGTGWPLFEFKVLAKNLPAGRQVDNLDFTPVSSGGAEFVKVALGCKTGTAETVEDKNPHAWITVFAPYNNPEIVVTVLVEEGGEGSSVAGPIAKKILEKYFESK